MIGDGYLKQAAIFIGTTASTSSSDTMLPESRFNLQMSVTYFSGFYFRYLGSRCKYSDEDGGSNRVPGTNAALTFVSGNRSPKTNKY